MGGRDGGRKQRQRGQKKKQVEFQEGEQENRQRSREDQRRRIGKAPGSCRHAPVYIIGNSSCKRVFPFFPSHHTFTAPRLPVYRLMPSCSASRRMYLRTCLLSASCPCSKLRRRLGHVTHLLVGSQVDGEEAVCVLLVRVGAGLEQGHGSIAWVVLSAICMRERERQSTRSQQHHYPPLPPRKRTMSLGHGVMQRRLPGAVGRVQRAAVLQQQVHHGRRAHGRRPVQRVLAATVAHAGRRRRRAAEQRPGQVEVVLGRDKVEDRLAAVVCFFFFFFFRQQSKDVHNKQSTTSPGRRENHPLFSSTLAPRPSSSSTSGSESLTLAAIINGVQPLSSWTESARHVSYPIETMTHTHTHLHIWVKTLDLHQHAGNVQLVRRGRPVDRQPAVVILAAGQLGVGLAESAYVHSPRKGLAAELTFSNDSTTVTTPVHLWVS